MPAKWQCRLFWGNPTTSPPHGGPRIVMSVLCDQPHPIPDAITQICGPGTDFAPGSGWTIGWVMIDQRPIRRWSQKARARVRQSNLKKRMEKKYPLFAQDFIAAELAARPSYYEGSYDQRP